MKKSAHTKSVLNWFESHGRKNLPWQKNITPYRVWLSEIMLQQTQVTTVIPYFERFIKQFPTLKKLALANEDTVLHLWTGLGYYSRARNLLKTAKIIQKEFQSKFPTDLTTLQQLPGIGRSTAGAILALSMHQQATILDGNVKRVLSRVFALNAWQHEKKLWAIAEALTPKKNIAAYTQAMMDLGAMICTRTKPKCTICPLQKQCIAYRHEQQTEFPGKKPKKTLPIRQIQLLLLYDNQGKILLEKRPAKGIWGGLWSLPEYNHVDIKHFCEKTYHCEIKSLKKQPPFRHTFRTFT